MFPPPWPLHSSSENSCQSARGKLSHTEDSLANGELLPALESTEANTKRMKPGRAGGRASFSRSSPHLPRSGRLSHSSVWDALPALLASQDSSGAGEDMAQVRTS